MNKIKLMYDVVKEMQKKEALEGKAVIKLIKDEEEHISLENEFVKSFGAGETKAQIKATVNTEGKKVEYESSTRITGEKGHFHNKCLVQGHSFRAKGVKAKLARMAFVLNLINKMEIETEGSQKVMAISIDSQELSECCKEKIQECTDKKHSCHCEFKELQNLQEAEGKIRIYINENNNVAKLEVRAQGEYLDDAGQNRKLELVGDVQLND